MVMKFIKYLIIACFTIKFPVTLAFCQSIGSKQWEYKTGGDVYSSPAIGSDGMVYVGSRDNKLYAMNPDGSKKWAFRTRDDVDSSPAIGSDGTIYVGSNDGNLYAITPNG